MYILIYKKDIYNNTLSSRRKIASTFCRIYLKFKEIYISTSLPYYYTCKYVYLLPLCICPSKTQVIAQSHLKVMLAHTCDLSCFLTKLWQYGWSFSRHLEAALPLYVSPK